MVVDFNTIVLPIAQTMKGKQHSLALFEETESLQTSILLFL